MSDKREQDCKECESEKEKGKPSGSHLGKRLDPTEPSHPKGWQIGGR